MTIELQQRLNTILLAFISVVLTAFSALVWAVYGSLPSDVSKIREDVGIIMNRQAQFAEMQDSRFRRVERDIDRLEAKVR